jgi:hypothetical protein
VPCLLARELELDIDQAVSLDSSCDELTFDVIGMFIDGILCKFVKQLLMV